MRTNVRGYTARYPTLPARFWYQLPPLQPRHRPALYVPRINAGVPIARLNPQRSLVIDANFATLWPERENLSPQAMLAVLNSAWVGCFLELTGVVLGAGALKIEASHLRRLLVPRVRRQSGERLHALGCELALRGPTKDVYWAIDEIVLGDLPDAPGQASALWLLNRSLRCERTLRAANSMR